MLFPPPPRPLPDSRVAVTGCGIVSPVGRGWSQNALAFRAGTRAIRRGTAIDVSRQRTKVAAEVDLPDMAEIGASRSHRQRAGRAGKMLFLAASEAWIQAGWQSNESSVALSLGTTSAGMELGEAYYRQAIHGPSQRRQPSRLIHYQAQRQALDLADALGFHGPVTIIANACASGANAIGHGAELIRSGRIERVMVGGYDALSQLVFAGFDSLKALSPTTCRPFDLRRDGLALGEGAAVLCLESLDSARKRGCVILGEIAGYGTATDLHHLTQPHPNGDAALASMSRACTNAGVGPDQIGYVNAHGTGTVANDSSEARAICRWAGMRALTLPVSSTKAGIGHLLGAAGAVEAAICLMALRGQWLPPESGIEEVDPACGFDLVRRSTDAHFEYALTNSFGFGGANASIVLRRYP